MRSSIFFGMIVVEAGGNMQDQFLEYIHYLKIERGLSENTIISYQRDLTFYLQFLESKNIHSWDELDRYIILDFL